MRSGSFSASIRAYLLLITLAISCISCVTAEEPRDSIRYVDSSGYSGGNIIRLTSIDDFQFLINRENIVVLFVKNVERGDDPILDTTEWFFPARNGEIYVVDAQGYLTLSDRDVGDMSGFPNGNTYYDAAELAIENFELYDYFMKNSFITVDDARRSLALGFIDMPSSDIPASLPIRISSEQLDEILRPIFETHRRRTSAKEPPETLLAVDGAYVPVDKLIWMLSTNQFSESVALQQDSRSRNNRVTTITTAFTLDRAESSDDGPERYASYVKYADRNALYFKEIPDDSELRYWGYKDEERASISGLYRNNRNLSRDVATMRVIEQDPELYERILNDAYVRGQFRPNMAETLSRPLVDSDWYYSFVLLKAQNLRTYREQAIAVSRGFADPNEYRHAIERGFSRKREYLESRDRGLETKDDLDEATTIATNDLTIIRKYRDMKKTLTEIEELTSFESLGDCYLFFIISRLSAGEYSVEKIKAEMDSYAADLYYEANTNEYRELYARWHSGQSPRRRAGRTNILQVIDERITSISTGRIHQVLSWQFWQEYGNYDGEKRTFTKHDR
jgi:hypothetical protein